MNNAGIVRFGAMEAQSVQDYIDVVNVNLLGSCFCAREIAPAMMERGSGHIINFTSINGIHPAPGVGMYGPTKAAMANMTQAMAIEWGPKGIRVNAIAPGMIDAGMSKPIFENPKVRAVRGGGVPLRALGEAADIAEAVLFLDSEGAKYILRPRTGGGWRCLHQRHGPPPPRMTTTRQNLILVGGIFHDFHAQLKRLQRIGAAGY